NNYWAATPLVRDQFSSDDQRKTASFIEIYRTSSNPAVYYASVVRKFSGTVIGNARRFLDDLVLYRYADVLLMKAEAKNFLGQNPADEINKVRARAYREHFAAHEFVAGTK